MHPKTKPSRKSSIQSYKQFLVWSRTVFKGVFTSLQCFTGWLKRVVLGFFSVLKKVQRRGPILTLLLLLIWIGIILGNFFIRGSYVFEGNLIVQEMSFTYTGATEKRFLNTIEDIKKLEIEGSQPEPLVLTGKFSSTSDPVLNQKLSQLNKLTIKLPFPKSLIIFTPTNSSQTRESELAILKLDIRPDTRINQLAYKAQPSQLSFCLQSATSPPETCLPQGDNSTQSNSAILGNLDLKLGQQPLTVSLGMFNLTELGIESNVDNPEELTFQFTPETDEPLLTVSSPTRLFIDLPNFAQKTKSSTANSPQWLREDIDVKNVRFSRFDSTERVTDEVETSTILSGEVRMGKEVIKLQANQFLVVLSDKPGIRKLRYIQIKSPQGLQTLISGESKGIAVGLYPKFPVESIEPSLLSKYFSQEAVNALLAFIAALTGVLLPRLFPEPDKNPAPPQTSTSAPAQNPAPTQNSTPPQKTN